jgi:drug/metabolite transporter (DMT)-like permease
MMWIFIFASTICLPIGAVSLWTIDVSAVSSYIWWLVLYIAIGATAGPYLLNAFAIAKVEASTVAVYIYLQPIIGFLLAAYFLGESFGVGFWIAAISVFAGVFLATRPIRSADRP